MSKLSDKLSIRCPKKWRIIQAVAHGDHKKKSRKQVFEELDIRPAYGYQITSRYKREIEEVKKNLTASDDEPRDALLAAKKFLQGKSPEFAEVLYKTATDEKAPTRERIQAARIALQEAGVSEATSPLPPIQAIMKALVLQAFYGISPDIEQMGKLIDIAPSDQKTFPGGAEPESTPALGPPQPDAARGSTQTPSPKPQED